MPDRDYNVNYNVNGNAAANLDALAAKLTAVDALLSSVGAKMASFGKGSSSGVNGLAKALGLLDGRLKASDASLAAAAAKAAALAASLGKASAAADELKGATVRVKDSTAGASAAMGGFMTRMLALQAARSAFHALMDESQRLEEYWHKLAKEAGEFRDSLRELASMKGKAGPDDDVTAGVLDLALKTRMTSDKARDLSLAYENFGPTVREKGHFKPAKGTPEQLEADALAEAGKTARRLGVSPDEAGGALGVAGMIHQFTSVEGAMEQVGGALEGLAKGSVKYTPGLKALNLAAAKLVNPTAEDQAEAAAEGAKTGKLGSYAEAGTMLGVFSLSTGGSAPKAGHQMVQASRAMNPAADYHGGDPAAALKAAGVEGLALPDQIVGLSEYMKAQKVADPRKWLEDRGIGTEATREVLAAQLKNADVLKQRIGQSRQSAKTNATGKATVARNDGYMASDKSAATAQVGSIKDVVDKALGVEVSDLDLAREAAEQRMRLRDPDYHSPMRGVHQGLAHVGTMFFAGVGGQGFQQEFDEKYGASATLSREGAKVGIDVRKRFPGLFTGSEGERNPQKRALMFREAADAVRAKGGDPLGLGDLDDESRRKVQQMRDRAAAGKRPTLPANRPAGGVGVGGPQASNAPGAAGFDPRLLRVNEDQARTLASIDRKLSGGGGGGASPMAGLPADGGDFSPRRT